jgi:hypothetical protein
MAPILAGAAAAVKPADTRRIRAGFDQANRSRFRLPTSRCPKRWKYRQRGCLHIGPGGTARIRGVQSMEMIYQPSTGNAAPARSWPWQAGIRSVLRVMAGIAAVSALCCVTQVAVPLTFVYLVEKIGLFLF